MTAFGCWPYAFPLIAEALNDLKAATCLIDGEAVCCDDRGVAILCEAAPALQ
jgi:ATP-dependent DNA ligase